MFTLQLYDKKEDDTRKCLLPKLWNAPAQSNETNESNMFDIYLCDNCEAELYSKEAYVVNNYLIVLMRARNNLIQFRSTIKYVLL